MIAAVFFAMIPVILSGPKAHAAKGDLSVLVAPDRTKVGKDFVPPTADNPAYCLILSAGPQELGDIIANEKIPAESEVGPLVKMALAKRHYLPTDERHPEPDLIIVYSWGSINPKDDAGFDETDLTAPGSLAARDQMLSIITTRNTDMRWRSDRNLVDSAMSDGRYFLLVGAYDYKALNAGTPRKKTMLWRTRLSTYNTGNGGFDMAAVLPRMLEVGAKSFGFDGYSGEVTSRMKKGVVVIGEAEVKEYIISGTTLLPISSTLEKQPATEEKQQQGRPGQKSGD